MYPPKLYSGPTIQSRSAARRAAQDLVSQKKGYNPKKKNTFRSFPGELKVTNSALGLRAKHPLLIAALEKVMIMIQMILAIRIEMIICMPR